MGKNTYYFSHDYNARNDEKIIELIEDYGTVAYGEYWIIAELLHEEETGRIELTDRFYRLRAKQARMTIDTYKEFIDDCCKKYELLLCENGYISSERVDRNKEGRQIVRQERSEAGKAGANARWGKNSNCHQNDTESMAFTNGKMANDSKRKERKVKEKKKVIANAIVGEMPTAGKTLKVQKDLFKNIIRTKASLIGFITQEKPRFIDPYVELWNIWATERGKGVVKDITDKRIRHFKVRVNEPLWDFIQILSKASKSDKCLTEGWFGFDFIIESRDKYLKLLEGNYDNKEQGKAAAAELTATEKKFIEASKK